MRIVPQNYCYHTTLSICAQFVISGNLNVLFYILVRRESVGILLAEDDIEIL